MPKKAEPASGFACAAVAGAMEGWPGDAGPGSQHRHRELILAVEVQDGLVAPMDVESQFVSLLSDHIPPGIALGPAARSGARRRIRFHPTMNKFRRL